MLSHFRRDGFHSDRLALLQHAFIVLQMENPSHGVGAQTHQRAAARGFPPSGIGRLRTGMALLGPNVHDRSSARLDQTLELDQGRSIDPVFRVHEFDSVLFHGPFYPVTIVQRLLQHQLFADGKADQLFSAIFSEISGQGFFADDVFPGPGGLDAELRMQIRRNAEIDDVDVCSLQKTPVIVIIIGDAVHPSESLGVIEMLRRDRNDVDLDAPQLCKTVHVEARRELGADHPDTYSLHAYSFCCSFNR